MPVLGAGDLVVFIFNNSKKFYFSIYLSKYLENLELIL